MIDIFNEVHKEKENSILMLVGQGPLMEEIKEKVKALGLEKNVMFLGQRNDVKDLYQAFDVFCLPSLYEGLGMVLIEAQSSGLKCITTTAVPEEANVTGEVTFIKLNLKQWKKEVFNSILRERKNNIGIIRKRGYDIKKETIQLEKKYLFLGGKNSAF